MVVCPALEAELPEDRVDVRLHGLRAEEELLADPLVRAALRHQLEDRALASGEFVDRIVRLSATDELRDDLGVERGAAAGNATDRVEEVVDVHDAVFQQVAEAAALVGEEAPRALHLDCL